MSTLAEPLLMYLREHKENRGTMANLRCVLIDSKRQRAWPFLARFKGIGEDFRALTVQYIAGFYATHPNENTDRDFGDSCRCLMDGDERQKITTSGEVGPVSRRFQHLLAAEGEEVFSRTLRFVMRCKSQDVSIDYQRLFDDLMQWQYYPESVRTRWARSFWAPREEEGS